MRYIKILILVVFLSLNPRTGYAQSLTIVDKIKDPLAQNFKCIDVIAVNVACPRADFTPQDVAVCSPHLASVAMHEMRDLVGNFPVYVGGTDSNGELDKTTLIAPKGSNATPTENALNILYITFDISVRKENATTIGALTTKYSSNSPNWISMRQSPPYAFIFETVPKLETDIGQMIRFSTEDADLLHRLRNGHAPCLPRSQKGDAK